MKLFLFVFLMIFSNFAFSGILEKLNKSNVKWTINNTGYDFKLGLLKDPSYSKKPIFTNKSITTLSKLDWRNKNGYNWITSIKDQGYCGSCVAFATTAVIEAQYNISNNLPNYNLNLSEQYLWSCGSGSCERGWWMTSGVSYAKSNGISEESCFSYKAGNIGEDISCTNSCSEPAIFKIKNYTEIGGWRPNITDIKKELEKGPILASMSVYEDFMYYGGGVYNHIAGDYMGGHAIVIIGYDDDTQSWICKNSWGKHWGEEGFFRIKYNDISNVGATAISVFVPEVKDYIKVKSPEHLTSLSDLFKVEVITLFETKPELYFVSKINNTNELVSYGGFTNNISNFDTSKVIDNRYWIWATSKNGLKSEKYTISVVNKRPEINLKMSLIDSTTNIVKDRVYLKIECSTNSVPLDELTLTFISNGEQKKSVIMYDPCPVIQIGWRTKMYPNGEYIVKGIGKVEKYLFDTNTLQISVKNE